MVTLEQLHNGQARVAVVGLGYVGLPLAVGLSAHMPVLGFDVNEERVRQLSDGRDWTMEIDRIALDRATSSGRIVFTHVPADLAEADIIIIAVPTPIDDHRNPDLTPLILASSTVARHMRKGCVVIYESTVYPGVTEEVCVPVLAKTSHLKFGVDFTVGYSPERINPGDKVHTLQTVKKVVSGSDAATTALLAGLYGTVVGAGIHQAPSIKVAEAAKVIENTQRDLNIALMNELSLIFGSMGIDTRDVLEAAGTKWNFLPFEPGLVGGHCIGVDPYYLTYKAEELGYHPQVILAGRRINDSMGKHIAEICVKLLIRQERPVNGARIGVMGITFKENIPDIRNTRIVDIVRELEEYGATPLVHDPHAAPDEVWQHYRIALHSLDDLQQLDALVVAVPHREYQGMNIGELPQRFAVPEKAVLLDIKGIYDREAARRAGLTLWRL